MLIEYDLRTQPYSVGDVLVLQERALLFDCPIDFQFVFDESRTVPGQEYIRDRRGYLGMLLPLGWCSPNVRSVSVVSESTAWPHAQGYMFYEHMAEFAKHDRLPELRWGKIKDGDYVSVQMRNNPHSPDRDSTVAAWVEFFRTTDDHFVLVGEVDQVPDLPNVTKRRGPVDEDLQAIIGARFHMGTSSGPATVAMFNRKPLCVFNTQMDNGFSAGFEMQDGRGRFTWSAPGQSLLAHRDTLENIRREYLDLCSR